MAVLKQVAALGGSGLQDWLAERVSAVVLAVYTLFWFFFVIFHPGPISYPEWKNLFYTPGMRCFTLFSVIALAMHARVGMWAVFADYVKSASLRTILNLAVLLQVALVVLWTIQILWGL